MPLTGHRHPTRKGGSLLNVCVWVFFERSRIVVDPRRGSSLAARCSRGYGTSVGCSLQVPAISHHAKVHSSPPPFFAEAGSLYMRRAATDTSRLSGSTNAVSFLP